MLSRRRILTVIAALLVVLPTLGCQAPPTAAGTPARGSTATGATLESGLPEPLPSVILSEESESRGAADSDFGGVQDVDDPFGLIGPAFSGIGFQSYTANCDPFDDAYGTCL